MIATRSLRLLWICAALVSIAMTVAQYQWHHTALLGAYLCAWWFWLGISLGSCVHNWVYAFTGGRWGEALQPILQSAAAQMPLLALLYLPLLIAGNRYLYPWMPIAHEKSWWLNSVFFSVRSVIYLALWIALAALSRHINDRRRAAIGLLIYGLSVSFASFDWLMSLVPKWYATGFGLLTASGQLLSAFAFGVAAYLQANLKEGRSRRQLDNSSADAIDDADSLNIDFGNLLLTYVLLWAYLAYTQFLIIWAENLPHEIAWYLPRSHGLWLAIGIGLSALHFAMPLLILLLRTIKKNSRGLLRLALWLLVAHIFDCVWLVLPSLPESNYFSLVISLIFAVAIGALWLWHWQCIHFSMTKRGAMQT